MTHSAFVCSVITFILLFKTKEKKTGHLFEIITNKMKFYCKQKIDPSIE